MCDLPLLAHQNNKNKKKINSGKKFLDFKIKLKS